MQKVVLITGAEHGLGLSLTKRLSGKGWVVFAGRQSENCPELEDLQADNAGKVKVLPLDVSSKNSVNAAVEVISGTTGHIDMLISNVELVPMAGEATTSAAEGNSSSPAEGSIRSKQDFESLHRYYDINALGPLRVVDALLPLLEKGEMKRMCFVSSETGSVNLCTSRAWYGVHMSKAAMNMEVKILFNRLRPEGYTFRMYNSGSGSFKGSNPFSGQVSVEDDAAAALAYFLRDRFEDEGNAARKDDNRLAMRDWLGREWPW